MAVDAINGSMGLVDDIPTDAATPPSAKVLNTTEPLSLSEQMFYIRGKIPRVTAFERGLPGISADTQAEERASAA